MTTRIFVSRDAGSVAVGADDVARALEQAAAKKGASVEIVRTGSRGLYWLEPMIEVTTPKGRIAFGPVTESDAHRYSTRCLPMVPTPCGLVSQTRFRG